VFKVDYRSISGQYFLLPKWHGGLTEVQARYQYADDVLVLQQYFKTVAAAQLSAETTGICKLIEATQWRNFKRL